MCTTNISMQFMFNLKPLLSISKGNTLSNRHLSLFLKSLLSIKSHFIVLAINCIFILLFSYNYNLITYFQGPWDVLRKVFSKEEHKKMSIYDKCDLFFYDYSIAPLFVQENYLNVQPHSEER